MKILALEFSSPVRSVAVRGGARPGYAEESGGRDTRAFELIDAALKQAELEREQIECIAVGLGPGSYAGIRIAIAVAQGWQLARSVKLLGLCSADVVAASAGQFGVRKPVYVGLEARPGELYVAHYDATIFERPEVVEPFHVSSEAERAEYERNGSVFRMDWLPELRKPAGVGFPPKANFLATLAVHRTNFVTGHELGPVYLRDVQFVKAPSPRFGFL
jgi:tRNA threonylcarbamoyl adenosine modification protein YeaZ